MRRWLVVAAFEGELSPFRAATFSEHLSFHAVGVGLVDAAIGISQLLSSSAATEAAVIFVGSVGAVEPTTELLTLVCPENVALASVGLLEGRSYLPDCSKTSYCANPELVARILKTGAQKCAAYSPLGITRQAATAELLALKSGASFESLELFAVAAACEKFGVPWAALQAVTNICGETGQEEWRANYAAAAKITAECLFSRFFTSF